MNKYIILGVAAVLAYLIGAIPFSFIVAKIAGVDIRKQGSGNIGATNVLRSAGKVPGILAYVLDIGKGMGVVIAAYFIFSNIIDTNFERYFLLVVGISAILGHIFPVYLGFKGGKGVATSAGVMFVIIPIPLLGAIVGFMIALFASKRIVSVGSTAAAILFPIFTAVSYFVPFHDGILFKLFFNHSPALKSSFAGNFLPILATSLAICAFVIIKHIPNYKRLMKGEELGFGSK